MTGFDTHSNIWSLAGEAGAGRLALIAVLAVAAMSTWLIADNHLWEHPRSRRLRREVHLYNAATTLGTYAPRGAR